MNALVSALRFLTLARRFQPADAAAIDVGAGAIFFPLVGLSFGLVLMGVNIILEPHLESEILAAVHVTVLIVLTGAVHLEELHKTLDGVRPAAAPSSSIGIYGLLATMLVVFFKIRSLEVIGESRPLTLLVVPAVARWPAVLFLYATSPAAAAAVGRVRAWQLLATTAIALAIAAYGLRLPGLWIGFAVSTLTLLSRALLQRRHGVLTREHLGAVIELSEALSFVLIASL